MVKRLFRVIGGLLLLGSAFAARAETVAISIHAPAAREVYVAGAFDPYWQKRHALTKTAGGRWTLALDLPPGRYEFQFMVDGQWRHDESLPMIPDAFGGYNNVLIVLPRQKR